MLKHLSIGLLAACLAACGSPAGGIASAGSTPVSPAVGAIGAIADATLPPPSSFWSTKEAAAARAAIDFAWDALDTAATAADIALVAKPSFKGTAAARNVAAALEGASTWLTIASQAEKASQADNYRVAIEQAAAAMVNATGALKSLKGN